MSWNAPGPEDRLSTRTVASIVAVIAVIVGVALGLGGGLLYFCYTMFDAFAH